MTIASKTAAAAIAFTLLLGGGSAAFAKAHDQGVADGDQTFPDGTGAAIGGPGGVSGGQKDGQRGDTASSNGSDNKVEPVVGNGANSN